jgi:hypothetical protein
LELTCGLRRIPLYKLHKITDEYVWISCPSLADKTPKKWAWDRFYRMMMLDRITNIFTKARLTFFQLFKILLLLNNCINLYK